MAYTLNSMAWCNPVFSTGAKKELLKNGIYCNLIALRGLAINTINQCIEYIAKDVI